MPADSPALGMAALARWLFAYHDWADDRVFAAARLAGGTVTRPGVIAGGQGDGSVLATLAHLADADAHWLARWQGNPRSRLRGPASFGGLEDVAAFAGKAAARRRAWLAGLDDAALARDLEYSTTAGSEQRQPLWQTLFHTANHATHHRAEACSGLTALGFPPETVELIAFVRTGAPGARGS